MQQCTSEGLGGFEELFKLPQAQLVTSRQDASLDMPPQLEQAILVDVLKRKRTHGNLHALESWPSALRKRKARNVPWTDSWETDRLCLVVERELRETDLTPCHSLPDREAIFSVRCAGMLQGGRHALNGRAETLGMVWLGYKAIRYSWWRGMVLFPPLPPPEGASFRISSHQFEMPTRIAPVSVDTRAMSFPPGK